MHNFNVISTHSLSGIVTCSLGFDESSVCLKILHCKKQLWKSAWTCVTICIFGLNNYTHDNPNQPPTLQIFNHIIQSEDRVYFDTSSVPLPAKVNDDRNLCLKNYINKDKTLHFMSTLHFIST